MRTEHGDDIYKYEQIELNFSSNICTDINLTGLNAYLSCRLDHIKNYPEPDAGSLARMLAEQAGIRTENIVVTNGATEAIYLLAQATEGCRSTISPTTFSEYRNACLVNHHNLTDNGDVIWLCNPNNPTGTVLSHRVITTEITRHPDKLFILDHSYEDYTLETQIEDKEALALGNVAVIHSMTKRYGIPGLRLGYVVAGDKLSDNIRRIKQPWSVNSLAILAGKYLIAKGKHADTKKLLDEAQRLNNELNQIKGITALPTQTNFMLATTGKGTAGDLKRCLAEKHRMLIRDASNFPGLSPAHFRVAAQGRTADDKLIEAIKSYMKHA